MSALSGRRLWLITLLVLMIVASLVVGGMVWLARRNQKVEADDRPTPMHTFLHKYFVVAGKEDHGRDKKAGKEEEKERDKRAVPDDVVLMVEQKIAKAIQQLNETLSSMVMDDTIVEKLLNQTLVSKGGGRRMEVGERLHGEMSERAKKIEKAILVAVAVALCIFCIAFYAIAKPTKKDNDDNSPA